LPGVNFLSSEHFLDSNILLSKLIKNHPNGEKATAYFCKTCYNRHISRNVHKECNKVFNRIDDVAHDFLIRIRIQPDVFDNSLSEKEQWVKCRDWIKNTYLESYISTIFPNLNYDYENEDDRYRYKQSLRDFVVNNVDDITDMALDMIFRKDISRDAIRDKYLGEVQESIRIGKESVSRSRIESTTITKHETKTKRQYTNKNDDEMKVYRDIYYEMYRLTKNSNDSVLLTDSYYVIDKKMVQSRDILFLTTDEKDILNNREDIEKYLGLVFLDHLNNHYR